MYYYYYYEFCVVSELNDGTVETVDGSSGHIRISSTQLLLTLTDVADSGVYVCNASNNVGFDTETAHLSVLGKNITTWYKHCTVLMHQRQSQKYMRSDLSTSVFV